MAVLPQRICYLELFMTCQECAHFHGAEKKIYWGSSDSMAFECPASGKYSFTFWDICPSFSLFQAIEGVGDKTEIMPQQAGKLGLAP
jgi:hypothetical protein